jgi:hypothetical protein
MIHCSPQTSTLEILTSVRAINARLRRSNEQLRILLAFNPLTAHAHEPLTSLQSSGKLQHRGQ